jgi:hypothetical protein
MASSSAAKRIAMVLAPILLFVFSLLHGLDRLIMHGMGTPDVDAWVQWLSSNQVRWLALHVAGLGLFPLLGLAVWWMLPMHRGASRISRVALAIYIVLYAAFDAMVGIGSYVLVHHRQGLMAGDRAVLDAVIVDLVFESDVTYWFGTVASVSWGIGVSAAAVALWRECAWHVGLPLAVSAVAMSLSHSPPYGAVAGIMLGISVWQFLTRDGRNLVTASTGVVPVYERGG